MFFKTTDDELMVRIATGDRGAFRSLFDRHGARLLGYCRRFMGNSARGEDMAQDTWMKIVRAAPHYKSDGKFAAWMLSLARNTCISEMRKHSEKFELASADAQETADLTIDPATVEQRLSVAEIKSKIDALPDTQRVVLTLTMTEELSYQQIADQLGLTESAVKSLLFRARKTLLKDLGMAV